MAKIDYKTYSNSQLEEVFKATSKKKISIDVIFLIMTLGAILIVASGYTPIIAFVIVAVAFLLKFKYSPKELPAIEVEVRRRKAAKK